MGGGIAGLSAAHRLARLGHRVTVFEAGSSPGGQVRTAEVAGSTVDVGAEAVHSGAPGVGQLLAELGLAEDVVRPAAARTHIWTTGGLRPLPAGVGPAGPTRLVPVLRSRVLSPRGLARAALEPVVPHIDGGGDAAVGEVVSRRFGREVTERLVDPLLGGLHAGDVGRLSVRAVTPQLAELVGSNRSLLLAHRARRRLRSGPELVTFRGGLGRLVDALVTTAPVRLRTSTAVRTVTRFGDRYDLHLARGAVERYDAVVVAAPAHSAGALLAPLLGPSAAILHDAPAASVATVVLAYPRPAVARCRTFDATGILVPSTSGRVLKSATFLGVKWPHLAHPDHLLVRLSAGRVRDLTAVELDDDELVRRLHSDLADATGLRADPLDVHVQRWPRAMAQLEVGHLERMGRLRTTLASSPGVVLAGAAFDGLGIASCVRSGERAAAAVHDHLRGAPDDHDRRPT